MIPAFGRHWHIDGDHESAYLSTKPSLTKAGCSWGAKMTGENDEERQEPGEDKIAELAVKAMRVVRRYGHELRNVTADRRGEIKELIEQMAGESE